MSRIPTLRASVPVILKVDDRLTAMERGERKQQRGQITTSRYSQNGQNPRMRRSYIYIYIYIKPKRVLPLKRLYRRVLRRLYLRIQLMIFVLFVLLIFSVIEKFLKESRSNNGR